MIRFVSPFFMETSLWLPRDLSATCRGVELRAILTTRSSDVASAFGTGAELLDWQERASI
ncbi:MAG: hypothetical protein KDA93_03145 [Planctomycetaceae bacterium]|nr:hypothetical protein [Planctomycetaceae bacterium]